MTERSSARISRIAPQRRHTLQFLREIRAFSPVFLDTEVDMSAVQRLRADARQRGERSSVLTYVLYATARVLARHPQANAAIRGGGRPKVARYPSVNGKITLDKTVGGERIVLSTVLTDLQNTGLAEIQRRIEHHRDGDPQVMPEYAGARLLHRLPWPVGGWLFRLGVRPLSRRATTFGTFAVTSLSHRPVDGFASVGGTTITLGLGQVAERPVVRDGRVAVAPTMRLTLTFDHRVIDGAEAADVLAEIKAALETFERPSAEPDAPAAAVQQQGAR
ncbi:2-oxo acid dehydrogenase subunit E2 [Kitasatospora sp. NPDC059648]|uniref:2-oxo acid dehydrogenase subunit E2 n=1 Tax=Kitasatospora sp. NPDC059648 TaxID=3346894 RepID=UPI00368A9C38